MFVQSTSFVATLVVAGSLAARTALASAVLAFAFLSPAAAQRVSSSRPTPPAVGGTRTAPCEIVAPGVATYSQTLSLQGLTSCSASSAGPWSSAFTPDGSELWVPLYGSGFGGENCQIARIDAQTRQLLGVTPVGLAPEEVVSGGTRYGYVTDSSSSTVSILSPTGQVLRTIDIPFDPGSFFQTAFPFGLAVSPDQSEVFVGTLDGSGDVFVIDVGSAALAPSRTLHLGAERGFARMLFAGQDLVLTATRYNPGFQGSTAEVILVNPDDPAGARTTVLASSPDSSAFPSSQDVALLCENRLFVAGFDMGANVYVLQAKSGELTGILPTQTSMPQGSFQSLGLSSRGLLCVADLGTHEVAFFDAWTEQWLGTVDASALPGFNSQVNELTFSPDGSRLVATATASDTLVLFDVQ